MRGHGWCVACGVAITVLGGSASCVGDTASASSTDDIDATAGAADPTIVKTRDGLVAGVREGDVLVWRGIPFAAPPVGPLRWRLPHPVTPWQGVRDASAYRAICP